MDMSLSNEATFYDGVLSVASSSSSSFQKDCGLKRAREWDVEQESGVKVTKQQRMNNSSNNDDGNNDNLRIQDVDDDLRLNDHFYDQAETEEQQRLRQERYERQRERKRLRRRKRKRDRAGKRMRKMKLLQQQQQQEASSKDAGDDRGFYGHANERSRSHSSSSTSSSSSSYDDTIGAYLGKEGDVIADNYEVIKELGVGTFGRVLLCQDISIQGKYYAVKVVRKVKKYSESARIEAEIIEHIQAIKDGNAERGYVGQKEYLQLKKEKEQDSHLSTRCKSDSSNSNYSNNHYCVQMYKWFEWNEHVCIMFEQLGYCLLDFLKMNEYRPFEMKTIRTIAYQVASALRFLHDDCGIIHTDLKLENILFAQNDFKIVIPDQCDSPWRCEKGDCRDKEPSSAYRTPNEVMQEIRLIDFGGATYFDERGETGCYQGNSNSDYHHHNHRYSNRSHQRLRTTIINTRQYRSPEVIFQLGWSFPSDIWSLGCILMELFTGNLLFNTHDNAEHVALIDKIVGPIPDYLAKDAARIRDNAEYFDSSGRSRWPKHSTSRESIQFVKNALSLYSLIWGGSNHEHPFVQSSYSSQFTEKHLDTYTLFYDVVSLMLMVDPTQRITASDILQHVFFQSIISSSLSSSISSSSSATNE